MDGFGAGGGPLIAIRAIHFGATVMTAGSVIFWTAVARPVLRAGAVAALARAQTLRLATIGLAFTIVSGAIWLLLEAVSMSGLSWGEAMTAGVVWTVLRQTQFGWIAEIRAALAVALAAGLACQRFAWSDSIVLIAALGLTAAIAWTGHAGSTAGELGILHGAADALHLLAAAAWIGGLLPLALLLAAAGRRAPATVVPVYRVVRRFSALGVISVATLVASGVINTWILVGSVHALLVTEYGQLLMLKLAIFALMLVFAALNRFWLTPQLGRAPPDLVQQGTLHRLTRNSTVEIGLGSAILAIVGMLGTLHPAIHLM
jgi:putative copper resistance protein D